jgi:hypothetical protein
VGIRLDSYSQHPEGVPLELQIQPSTEQTVTVAATKGAEVGLPFAFFNHQHKFLPAAEYARVKRGVE